MIDYKKVHRLQTIVDEADPFLIEALAGKDPKELEDYFEKFEKEWDVIKNSRNADLKQRFAATRRAIVAFIELKSLSELDRRIADGDEEVGGVTIS